MKTLIQKRFLESQTIKIEEDGVTVISRKLFLKKTRFYSFFSLSPRYNESKDIQGLPSIIYLSFIICMLIYVMVQQYFLGKALWIFFLFSIFFLIACVIFSFQNHYKHLYIFRGEKGEDLEIYQNKPNAKDVENILKYIQSMITRHILIQYNDIIDIVSKNGIVVPEKIDINMPCSTVELILIKQRISVLEMSLYPCEENND